MSLSGRESWLYRGGFVLISVLTAVVIASISNASPGPLGMALSIRPIRWVGKISYGIYLWHWPVIALVTEQSTGIGGGWLLVLRLALVVGMSALSFYVIELPIRRARFPTWRHWVSVPVGVGATAAIVLVGTVPAAEVALSRPIKLAVSAVQPSNAGPISVPPGRVPSPANPLRVMLVGDSVMWDEEPALTAALEATGVVQVRSDAVPGWGLANLEAGDQSFGWQQHWPADISGFHPEVVVLMTSWDLSDALTEPATYTTVLSQALQYLVQNGVDGVALLEFPKTNLDSKFLSIYHSNGWTQQTTDEGWESSREAWNSIASAMPAVFPGHAAFLRTASSLESNGQFTEYLPLIGGQMALARAVDGMHLCPAGAQALAAAVLYQLAPMLALPPAKPGWWAGAWQADPRFLHEGLCPG